MLSPRDGRQVAVHPLCSLRVQIMGMLGKTVLESRIDSASLERDLWEWACNWWRLSTPTPQQQQQKLCGCSNRT